MRIHTTNYQNTFIQVADDCPVTQGDIPPVKGDKKSVANLQFDLVKNNPYKYTSDEVFFLVYAERNDIVAEEFEEARQQFFSKGQPCFRASPLTKRYGWGVHNDEAGRIAIYGRETEDYQNFSENKDLKIVKAMRTNK
ncbi:DUF6157 family protein [Adhaeribacter soli]|uniref:Uncharacterized protein n=1 Tax=Adhaeribacter soli TaxID=2607655 RepID=A0A5N1J567_9BACT|nr:DUF6157 family protein [Adhaeribacter soli]KAA9345840.1 hypothetical protein F0P94_01790 [Adhaeribacter soli]